MNVRNFDKAILNTEKHAELIAEWKRANENMTEED
jgi:hypothetical protein